MTGIPRDTPLPVTIESEDVSFEAFRKVVTYTYREDESGRAARRELIVAGQSVAVIVLDPKLDKLVMIRQFRLGAQLGTGCGFTSEIPAGRVDEGEEPLETARREVAEETGLNLTHIEQLCQFLTTPGMTDEVMHLFYAEADASNLITEAGLEGETEQTFPYLVKLEDAMRAIDENHIHNGIVMLALMWFSRHRDKLVRVAK